LRRRLRKSLRRRRKSLRVKRRVAKAEALPALNWVEGIGKIPDEVSGAR